ncbi:hypothetical protein [uncultured Winogradskyella sp.]|uniref:hypothetical protein n=1 Tax=uncultured Winogradskyella sp. TaxID=395353 RepID=UPI002627DA0E|nr:hypothetical protein [uncultured Winogradskyella sp.]
MHLDLSNNIDIKKAYTYLSKLIDKGSKIELKDLTDKPFDIVLSRIYDIIETYESGAFKDLYVMHRELTANIYYLSKEQVKAHQKWNAQYYKSEEKTNAGKERECDKLVPELYMCRKIIETAKGVSIAMGYEIKLN